MEAETFQSLEIIPLDVISEIGKHLDIKSITRFGSTKRNFRQFFANPQQLHTYRAIYFEQYNENKFINKESTTDWAKLCRTHCYNRLKEFTSTRENPKIKMEVDYLTNNVRYENGYRGGSTDYRAIAAELPLQPIFRNGSVGYYEITVKSNYKNEGYINFGLSFGGATPSGQAVGWSNSTFWIGWHGDDGKVFDSRVNPYSGVTYGPSWAEHKLQVTVGCLINFRNNKIAFTMDGAPYNEIDRGLDTLFMKNLHPVVAVRENMEFKFNFGGEPFKFDPNGYDVFYSSVVATDEFFVDDTVTNDF